MFPGLSHSLSNTQFLPIISRSLSLAELSMSAISVFESPQKVSSGKDQELQDPTMVDFEKTAIQGSDGTDVSSESPQPVRSISGILWAVSVAALYSTAFLYGLHTTIVADVQVPIIKAFGHVDQLRWIDAGFPLGSVSVILPLGVLYGLFNVKVVYICSVLMF